MTRLMERPGQMLFSIIVPVYNRPDEVADLLDSLEAQTDGGFEIVIVEDGSTVPCLEAEPDAGGNLRVKGREGLRLKYYRKPNEGRSIARNYGMARADGDFFVFVDSDCILPPGYIAALRRSLAASPADCFGGPDAAHSSFSKTQKAINYAMTSFLTTGGIRGGKVSLEKFVPRTFNMGFSRNVYKRVGGFREMFSEDIDMSTRIRQAGFSMGLIPEAFVWHKRRINLKKFFRQVYVFGMSRITLQLLYPGSLKLVHTLPALFVLGVAILFVLSVAISPWFLLPIALYLLCVFIGALLSTKSTRIAAIAVPAAVIQLGGYGSGFIKAYFLKIVLGRGRDINQEIQIRKGK